MRKTVLLCSTFFWALLLGVPNTNALNITIVESQSFSAAHTMDTEWATVAAAMGHTPTIVPQSTLDTGAFIPGTDVLIISSASIALTPVRMSFVFDCMLAGKGVYIQSEAFATMPGNDTWQTIVNMYATAFTWTGTMSGIMRPTVHNHIGAEFNAKPVLDQMFDGCFGTWGPGVEGNLRWQNNEVGYVFDPLNFPFAGMAITNTDQDWIISAPDYALMENYIDVLIDQPPLELNIRLAPVGPPISLPSGGGSFSYNAQIEYTGWTPVNFVGWIRLILPSGTVWSPPLAGPASYTWFAPNITPIYSFTQFIPAFAPPGTYYVQGVLADVFPGFSTVYDTDNFPFQKLMVGPDGTNGELVPEWESAGDFTLASNSPDETIGDLPGTFVLGDAYPNPFNPSTTVNVVLNETATMQVAVINLHGRVVATLANGTFSSGNHTFNFNATGMASGVYFLQVRSGGDVQTQKLVLMQ